MLHATAEINQSMHLPQQQSQLPFQTMFLSLAIGIGILFVIAIIAVLHYYRGAFARPAEPPQIESTVA
jgi:uncharacterized membrane protein